MILTIILGMMIGFILFWLGYLTASMMFLAKHTDEVDKIDILNNQVKENEKKKEKGISDMR